MRLLFSILITALVLSQSLAASECSSKLSDSDEIEKLSCEIQNITNDILSDKEVVPSKIYHYGKKEYLDENIKQRNIPQQAWDDFIMGGKTRFELKKSRRGLYGTGGLDTNGFGTDEYNWLMEISIKKECRDPSRVASLADLGSDPKFIKWLSSKENIISLENFKNNCALWDYYKGFNDDSCEDVVNKYLDEAHIGVVQDHIIQKSFYIRDRNCIETIKGTPDELLAILSTNPALWSTKCGNQSNVSLPGILLQSLKLKKEPLREDSKNNLLSYTSLNMNPIIFDDGQDQREKIAATIKATYRCDKKHEKQTLSDYIDFGLYDMIEWNPTRINISELNEMCRD